MYDRHICDPSHLSIYHNHLPPSPPAHRTLFALMRLLRVVLMFFICSLTAVPVGVVAVRESQGSPLLSTLKEKCGEVGGDPFTAIGGVGDSKRSVGPPQQSFLYQNYKSHFL